MAMLFTTIVRMSEIWAALPEPIRKWLSALPGWCGIAVAVLGALFWIVEPHLIGAVREAAQTEPILAHIADIDRRLEEDEHRDQHQTEEIARLSEAVRTLIATVEVGNIECNRTPETGHFVGDGRPGETVAVVYRSIVRQRAGCGVASVTHTIHDGKGFLRRGTPSFDGVAISVGAAVDLRYELTIPIDAAPGPSRYCPGLYFPEATPAARPQSVPCVNFTILLPSTQGDDHAE